MSDVEVLEPTAGVEETQPTADVPATPEAVAPPPAGEEPVSEASATEASTRARDPKTGRFTKADGSPVSDAEQAALEATALASPQTPTPDAAKPPETPAPVTAPFVVRGDGQKFTFPDAALNEAGDLTIKATQVPNLRMLIAEGLAHRGSWRQKEQGYQQQIEQAGAVEKARADRAEMVAAKLIDAIGNVDWMTAAVADPREAQYLIRELALEFNQAKLAAPKVEERAEAADVPPEQIEQAARTTLNEYIEELLESPQAKAVYTTPEQRQAVTKRFQRRLAAYFKADGNDILLHENSVDADFMEELNERVAHKKAADEQARKLAEAAAKNAARNATSPVPSTVPAKGSPTPGEVRTPKTKAQWAREHGFA